MMPGTKVVYLGCTKEQIQWGGNSNPIGKLHIGIQYTISCVEEHSWHTKISLEGVEGQFNSVCFDEV